MKCVDFQNEFEERNALSEMANLHLEDCKNCQKFSYKQNRVWEMLGSLGQVKAPGNFNFGVKARIADTKSGNYQTQTSFFPALRYVLPMGFVIILLSFVALSGLYFVGTQETPMASEQQTSTTPVKNEDLPKDDLAVSNKTDEDQITSSQQDNLLIADKDIKSGEKNSDVLVPEIKFEKQKIAIRTDNKVLVADNKDKKPEIVNTTVIENEDDTRSKDSAGTSSPTIIQPEFDSNKKVDAPVNPDSVKPTDIKEVLELSGIGTSTEKGRLKVTSIRKNSIAETSGVKVGDLIEAINGKKITDEPLQGKTINIETITVLRNGETKEIAFKAN
jgi:membrane-associated protease RseP (regulator of RpoE activity)